MKYTEALAWLYGLQRFGIKLGLENIRRLIAELDVEFENARVIHVAGTNGKGSVCAMIDSICRAQEYRTGLFISPHLVTFRERIRVDGEMISEKGVAAGLTNIRKLVADWDPHPTFFEITTALALKHFAVVTSDPTVGNTRPSQQSKGLPSPSPLPSSRGERITCRAVAQRRRKVRGESKRNTGVDIIILETGLGGRLDATNAIQSDVAVITPIALDHEKWLGDSLAKIAGEKAGIIKAQTPVVSAPQLSEAAKVIRARAAKCEAPLQFVDQAYQKSPIALRGEHQKLNAAIAIETINVLSKLDGLKPSSFHDRKIDIDDAAITRGLATVEWPGRFQCWDKRTVIDGAHNPAAAQTLVQTWREIFGDERATMILAILADKDLRKICETLAAIADSVLLPKIRSERAVPPEDLARVVASVTPPLPYSIALTIDDALKLARSKPNPILITGSLHFAGEALAHLQGKPAAFEECMQ